ncbi:MAG: zinc ribbon domain-containing protein [Armatimonadota bacterium]|nr:zinc ribbon domain-containing protein [Armatimonadota bacterium]
MLINCRRCGAPASEGTRFCAQCGADLREREGSSNKVFLAVAVSLAFLMLGGGIFAAFMVASAFSDLLNATIGLGAAIASCFGAAPRPAPQTQPASPMPLIITLLVLFSLWLVLMFKILK